MGSNASACETIFASTHLPLRLWSRAIYHLTQTKQGISGIELGRPARVTQTTAWKAKHKLKQIMLERDATKRLTGRVKIDDAYLGGERTRGKRGCGAPGKQLEDISNAPTSEEQARLGAELLAKEQENRMATLKAYVAEKAGEAGSPGGGG